MTGGYLVDEDGNKYYNEFGIEEKWCVCCGRCVDNCPMRCIQIKGSAAEIDYSVCNMCAYCMGLCPTGAIGYNRKVIIEYANHE